MSTSFFEFYCPVKVVAGFKALEHLPFELRTLGVRRPLLVTDRGVREAGLCAPVQEALESAGLPAPPIFDAVPPDSSTRVVAEAARVYREHGCDGLLAVGGGSVIDTSKAVDVLVSEGGDDIRAYSGTSVLTGRLRPLFVLPTTSGTGSEVTNVLVLVDADAGVKLPFVSQFLLPDVAILDPRMTLRLPPQLTAATAMDAMTHAIEAFICLSKNPLSDAYATAAIRRIADHLLPVLRTPSDAQGRLELSLAATMAGIAFSNSMVGLVHALGHSVGAVARVPHGVCMNVLLPFALEFNLPARREAIGELLLPLGGPDVYARTPAERRAETTIARLRALRDELHAHTGLPRTLGETRQVRRDQLPEIARLSVDDGALLMNPLDVDVDQALTLLERAF